MKSEHIAAHARAVGAVLESKVLSALASDVDDVVEVVVMVNVRHKNGRIEQWPAFYVDAHGVGMR